jgi:hypothetical protein
MSRRRKRENHGFRMVTLEATVDLIASTPSEDLQTLSSKTNDQRRNLPAHQQIADTGMSVELPSSRIIYQTTLYVRPLCLSTRLCGISSISYYTTSPSPPQLARRSYSGQTKTSVKQEGHTPLRRNYGIEGPLLAARSKSTQSTPEVCALIFSQKEVDIKHLSTLYR